MMKGGEGDTVGSLVELSNHEIRERLRQGFPRLQAGRSINGVAHDLNNLLGIILANAELLDVEADLPERARANLEELIESVRTSSALIDALLEIARPPKEVEISIDPVGLLKETVAVKRHDMSRGRIQHTLNVPPDLPLLQGNRPQLRQALLFLLDNAIEAEQAREGARVALSADHRDGTVAWFVWNGGPPIPEQDRDRVFEPFHSTKPSPHLGLGLPLARQALRDHGGDLVYDPDRGFVAALPV